MLKIPKKYSLALSLALSVLFFAACVHVSIRLPHITETLINLKDRFPAGGSGTVLLLAYLILATVTLADVLLFVLLLRVRQELGFTETSIALVRAIAWCCMLCGLVFAALGYYFLISFAVAFAAVFLGICLRVVKNVLEEATEIKSENDLTV